MISAKAFGIEVVKSSYNEELVRCPFHVDRSPSAWFSPAKGLFWCSVCHLGLNVHQLAERLKIDAIDLEGYESEVELPDFDLYSGHEAHWHGEREYVDYIRERGISHPTAWIFHLEWSEAEEAVVFPILNAKAKRIGALLRYRDGKPRYKRFGESLPLWPFWKLGALTPGQSLVITEGPWSALRIHTVDSTRAVFSTLGARAPRELADLLAPYNPVILYDDDAAGNLAAERMQAIAPSMTIHTIAPSPDDMDDETIRKLLRKLDKLGKRGFEL